MKSVKLGKKPTVTLVILLFWLIALVTVLLLTLTKTAAAPSGARPVYCVERSDRKVALTFNAAWDDSTTDAVLSTLERYRVKATFFFVGTFAERYPETVVKIHNAGHEVGNHSMTHRDPTAADSETLLREIDACSETLQSLTGVRPALYRAPSGAWNAETVETAAACGMTAIQWSADSVDWKDPSPAELERRVLEKTAPGGILLFHLGKENTAEALPGILDKLLADGYECVTVSELLLPGGSVDPEGVLRPAPAGNAPNT